MNDKKIRLASQVKSNKYKREVDEILNALDDIEEGWASSLITDESSFADYDLRDGEIALLSFKLQEEIKETDLIVDIAKKMNYDYCNRPRLNKKQGFPIGNDVDFGTNME
jgi:hypothetical protein